MSEVKLLSAYWPIKRQSKNKEQWLQMLKAKRREINFGTHHKIAK